MTDSDTLLLGVRTIPRAQARTEMHISDGADGADPDPGDNEDPADLPPDS